MKLENIHQPSNPASPSFVRLRRALLQTEIDDAADSGQLRNFQDEIDQMRAISASPTLALAQLSELLRDRLDALAVLNERLIAALDEEAVRVGRIAGSGIEGEGYE